MAIIVNGYEHRTLSQPLYVNGKQVMEAYANGVKVYPESDHDIDEFVMLVKAGGIVRVTMFAPVACADAVLTNPHGSVRDYWGGNGLVVGVSANGGLIELDPSSDRTQDVRVTCFQDDLGGKSYVYLVVASREPVPSINVVAYYPGGTKDENGGTLDWSSSTTANHEVVTVMSADGEAYWYYILIESDWIRTMSVPMSAKPKTISNYYATAALAWYVYNYENLPENFGLVVS